MSELEYLYVIEFHNGTVKVGRTSNPSRRVASHKATGKALGVPVVRAWVSDAHEDSRDTERRLLDSLPESTAGSEWFTGVDFNQVRETAQALTQARTAPELYYARIAEAKRLLEAHTGRTISILQKDPQEVDPSVHFLLKEDSYVMSSDAFSHYRQTGGSLSQKQFIASLEAAGIVRKRTMEGTRLLGIAIPSRS